MAAKQDCSWYSGKVLYVDRQDEDALVGWFVVLGLTAL